MRNYTRTPLSVESKIDKRGSIILACFAAVFALYAYQYAQYMYVAKSTVPIMDFWAWIDKFGQSVHDGTVRFAEYFNSDGGEHVQPLCMAINFLVLEAFDFDVQPLVTIGLYVRLFVGIILMAAFVFFFRNRENNYYLMGICTLLIGISAINYNQWEMTTEPFSLTSIVRVSLYLISFFAAQQFVVGIRERSNQQNIIFAVLLGLYTAVVTVLISASYFVAHLPAIGFAFLWCWYCNRDEWKKYFWPLEIWAIISFIGACVYYVIVSQRGVSQNQIGFSISTLLLLIEGVCLYWAAAFLHLNIAEKYGLVLYGILGALVVLYIVHIIVRYMKLHRNGKGLFPVMCVLYASLAGAVITIGRVSSFGVDTMTSSRYVVESSIGLVGLAWMTYDVYINSDKTKLNLFKSSFVTVAALGLLVSAASIEKSVGPYRGIYADNLYEMVINIDDYSDDQLGQFQANSPEQVRRCVEFFRENDLSVFSENYA